MNKAKSHLVSLLVSHIPIRGLSAIVADFVCNDPMETFIQLIYDMPVGSFVHFTFQNRTEIKRKLDWFADSDGETFVIRWHAGDLIVETFWKESEYRPGHLEVDRFYFNTWESLHAYLRRFIDFTEMIRFRFPHQVPICYPSRWIPFRTKSLLAGKPVGSETVYIQRPSEIHFPLEAYSD